MAAVALILGAAAVAGCGDGDGATSTASTTAGQQEEPVRVPDRFGTATLSSGTHPGCDTVVGGDTVTVEAGGYLPGAEVVVALQIVEADAAVVATVAASADGTVAIPVTLPDEPAGTVGGFEVIGDGPDGLLLNEALLLFQDPDACGTGA